jgi:hypothetical protein
VKRSLATRELLAKVARDYYLNDLSQSEIAGLPELRVKQTTVASWLRQAKDLGIISFDIDPVFGITGRESLHLRDRLKEDFELEDCLVVEPPEEPAGDANADGDVHIAVANRTGERLKEWIQAKDHVGTAGGRAVVQVCRFLKRRAHPRNEIRVSPLSGRIWTGDWQVTGPGFRRPLDADDAASLLAFGFERQRGTRFSLIGHSLYPGADDAHLAAIFKENCAFLPNGKWNWDPPPKRAIVGIGWLGGAHRIVEFLRQPERARIGGASHLHAVASEFEAAMEVAGKDIDLGDLANRLFPALPLPSDPILKKDDIEKTFEGLVRQLEALNRKAIVVDWMHLRDIPSIWAVCAGSRKKRVLWTILLGGLLDAQRGKKRLISEISVDAATARELIDAKREYNLSDEATRAKYLRLASLLFPDPSEPRLRPTKTRPARSQ